MVDRLSRLIAIPSVAGTDAEIDVQHVLADWLRELDCDVDTWQIDLDEAATAEDAPGQEVPRSEAWGVVGTVPGVEDGTPALVFSGHTDVVPTGDPRLWDGDPFVPRLVDGSIHGRGACDMKGGWSPPGALAAMRTAGCPAGPARGAARRGRRGGRRARRLRDTPARAQRRRVRHHRADRAAPS